MNAKPLKAMACVAVAVLILALCLFGNNFSLFANGIFGGIFPLIAAVFKEGETQWMSFLCLGIYFTAFFFINSRINSIFRLAHNPNFWLAGLLLINAIIYTFNYPSIEALILLAGALLGQGALFLLNEEGRMQKPESGNNLEIANRKSAIVNFMVVLVGLLAFSSWWHLDMSDNDYIRLRWTGLWNNPNIYGMLMGAGVTLAVGLLAGMKKEELRMKNSGEERKADGGWNFLRSLRSFAAGLVGERSRPGCRSPRLASNTGNASDGASLAASEARALPIFVVIAAGVMAG